MKRLLILSLCILWLISSSSISSAVTIGHPMQSKMLASGTLAENDLVIAKNREIYGYTLFAHTATGAFTFYDARTVSIGANTPATYVIDEGGEATAGDQITVWYPKPLITDNGLSVHVVDANIVIFYQK